MYILQNLKDRELYIGSTNNLERRYGEHNAGLVESTKMRTPLILVYAELYRVEEDARYREQSLKLRGRARRQLLNKIKNSFTP